MNTRKNQTRSCRTRGNNNIIMLSIVLIAILSVALIGSTHFVMAKTNVTYEKNFQAIEVQQGDTLTSIAEEYAPTGFRYQDYIDEIVEMNQIKDEQIHAGCYIMIPVYSVVSSK